MTQSAPPTPAHFHAVAQAVTAAALDVRVHSVGALTPRYARTTLADAADTETRILIAVAGWVAEELFAGAPAPKAGGDGADLAGGRRDHTVAGPGRAVARPGCRPG